MTACAAAALAELQEGPAFTILFTDIVLPGDLDGVGLAKDVLVLAPDTKILLISGFSGHDLLRLNLPGVEVLLKPYHRLGTVQSYGAVNVVDPSAALTIVAVSETDGRILRRRSPDRPVPGRR